MKSKPIWIHGMNLIMLLLFLCTFHCTQKAEVNMDGSHALAITMWDFSWLERRWPGAGYENWDTVLDELKERGYDAVRIDAYPHLVAADPQRVWTLHPHWDNQMWGSPALNKVQVQPNLNIFISKCRDRHIKVALSTWWREDTGQTAEKIRTPQQLGEVWKKTLDSINDAGLLNNILYVDLNNEFPIKVWTPYLPGGFVRNSEEGKKWMSESIAYLRQYYPDLDYTFSFTTEYDTWESEDVSFLDLLELHLWMVQFSDFYERVHYHYPRWGNEGYSNLVEKGEEVYQSNREQYQEKLKDAIHMAAAWSKQSGKPLGTTECWGVVDYKDWPLLSWDWVKELCALGTLEAVKTGRWKYIATSNFCGPQFVGMWRDITWHKKLTDAIHNAQVDTDLISMKKTDQ